MAQNNRHRLIIIGAGSAGICMGISLKKAGIEDFVILEKADDIGGELKGYTELLQESRAEALERLQQQAEAAGANAVLNIRFSTSSVAQGAAELLAYGTAVVLE